MKGVKLHFGQKHLLFVISALIIALIIIVLFIRSANVNTGANASNLTIKCVPAPGCHPKTCVDESTITKASPLLCTQECAPGTLDCGQGSCVEVNGECEVQWKN